jgi:hypothetical protein
VGLEICRRGADVQSIRPGTAAIGFDPFPGHYQIRSGKRLRKQVGLPQAFGFLAHQPCSITSAIGLGFTSPSFGSPRLPGLLMLCTAKPHERRLSFSFGPSPQTSSSDGLC